MPTSRAPTSGTLTSRRPISGTPTSGTPTSQTPTYEALEEVVRLFDFCEDFYRSGYNDINESKRGLGRTGGNGPSVESRALSGPK